MLRTKQNRGRMLETINQDDIFNKIIQVMRELKSDIVVTMNLTSLSNSRKE